MRPLRDPEGAELSHLAAACQLSGKAILEIGSGAGRLTWQYAALPRRVAGIDPAASELRQAQRSAQQAPAPHVSFIQAMGEGLPFRSQAFDVALFASSL
jgi:2-polyprenyl-6-hydroxyphenyl methylase/3-demethylubiquinone-9 3-methyltransferase